MLVEIWSDIACPWCYIGKRRFEQALAQFEHRDEVEVRWRSFELDPSAPAERPGTHADHLPRKYGMSVEQARERLDAMTATAAADGLELRFDRSRGANTFDAHRLVHLAAAHGVHDAMKERLLRAYFTDGELVSDRETLVRLAADAGLDAAQSADALASGAYADEVREDERLAGELGISGVPFFVADRSLALSGAHEPALLLKLLRKAREGAAAPAQ